MTTYDTWKSTNPADQWLGSQRQSTKANYETLRKAVDALGVVHGTLSDRLDDMLDNARINADDTVYRERAATDWSAVATASLEGLCADSTDYEATAWFAAHGLRF